MRVSSKSYETAVELQTVIETKHWEQYAVAPLTIQMRLLAISLGMMCIPGIAFTFMIARGYEKKGYTRKAFSFVKWFALGIVLSFCLLFVVKR